MNRDLECYTEIDSIYDARRALIQKWFVKSLISPNEAGMSDTEYAAYVKKLRYEGDRLWEMYAAKPYRERRMDAFDFTFCKFNREEFDKLWAARSLSDWKFGWYPSKFTKDFLKSVIDMEMLVDTPISFRRVVLHVNIHPYALDDKMKADLIASLQTRFGGKVEVKLLDRNPAELDIHYYKSFNYVMKYDIITSKDSRKLMDSLGSIPTTTAFLTPDILLKEDDLFEGEIADRMFAGFTGTANFFKVIPVLHSFYDYA